MDGGGGGGGAALPDAHAWALDPLYWSRPPLLAQQIHEMPGNALRRCEHSLYGQRPVQRASIVGFVVGWQQTSGKVVYMIDDGSNVVQCIRFITGVDKTSLRRFNAIEMRAGMEPRVQLGALVRVEGTMRLDQQFDAEELPQKIALEGGRLVNGQAKRRWRVLYVERLLLVDDPNEELAHWAQVERLSRSVYSQPAPPELEREWRAHRSTLASGRRRLAQPEREALANVVMNVLGPLRLNEQDQGEATVRTAEQLLQDAALWRRAEQELGKRKGELQHLLIPALELLEGQGRLFRYGNKYGVTDRAGILYPAILVCLAQFESKTGVSLKAICSWVRQDPRCVSATDENIQAGVEALLQRDVICSPRPGHFKIKPPED